jgi:predicted transcriptional regulator
VKTKPVLSTDDTVRDFLRNGGRGTSAEIAKALGIKQPTVYACLRRLEHAGDAALVARIPVFDSIGRFRNCAHVYARPALAINNRKSLVERAITWRHMNDGIHAAWWPVAVPSATGASAC